MLLLLAVSCTWSSEFNPAASNLALTDSKEKISPAIDFTAYKSWLTAQSTTATDASGASPHEAATAPRQPKYPASFAHIVELIMTGQPIPGIEHIPDTVLTGYSTIGEKPQRRKPWETNDGPRAEDNTLSNQPESTS